VEDMEEINDIEDIEEWKNLPFLFLPHPSLSPLGRGIR